MQYYLLDFAFYSADNKSMKRIGVVCVFFLGFGGLLLAQSDEFSSLEADIVPPTASNFRQEGIASWYGAEFAGRATASGEIFDPAQLTAAHAELPFGTYLIVTNTENGKKIAVRVNDRGPFVRSRILDVSRAAAERLDMLAAGTTKVVIEATTNEAAQSLVRELGMNPLSVARASPPAAAPRAANTPSSNTAPAAQPSASATPAATPPVASVPSGQTASAAAQPSATPPVTPAPSNTAPAVAVTPSGNTASATAPPATAPATTPFDDTASPAAQPPAASTTPATTAGVPVMSPAPPRTPAQSPVAPSLVPNPSVSRVTGRVENIPEIRRSTDSGYVVVDEQVMPVPPAYAPVIAPAPRVPAASRTAAPAVTPVAAAPQANPAASVPVTNPQPVGRAEFTGSPMVQGKNYRVQVGSFTDLKNASEVFLRLSDAGLNPSYEQYDDKYYRVVITNVKAEDADNLSRKLAEIGITEALSREDATR
jgi:rare lipoprotein A (peptidoglycan hydrolase)